MSHADKSDLSYFLKRMEIYRSNYHSELELRKNKAGDPHIARNKFLNEIGDEAKINWSHLGNLRSEMIEAWKDDKEVVLEVWIVQYFRNNNCTKKQIDEIAHYFGYEQFINDIHGLSFYKTVEQSWIEAAQYGYIKERGSLDSIPEPMINDEILLWRQDPKVDLIDFLKLAYSFHHSGILRAPSGNVTDTVELLALQLNFPLPERWQSNLSAGFENVNSNHDHYEFMNLLRGGLTNYIQSRNEKKEKKKGKK